MYVAPIRVIMTTLAPATTRDLAAVDATIAYTGVGFKPSGLIVMACKNDAYATLYWSLAFAGGNIDEKGINVGLLGIVHAHDYLVSIVDGGGSAIGVLQSLDVDGFTIAWQKTGAPSGIIYLLVLALK